MKHEDTMKDAQGDDAERLVFNRWGHLTELTVNRLTARDLEHAEREVVESHLESCDACREKIEQIKAFDADLELPPLKVVPLKTEHANTSGATSAANISESSSTLEREPDPDAQDNENGTLEMLPPAQNKRIWVLAAVGAAAAVLLVFIVDLNPPGLDPGSDNGVSPADRSTVRVKGSQPLDFDVYIHDGDGARQADDGEVVHPGDRIGFRVNAPFDGHLMVLGVDNTKSPYLCYPQNNRARSLPISSSQGSHQLDAAMRLDNVLGRERMIAVLCPSSFSFDQAVARVKPGSDAVASKGMSECIEEELTLVKKP